MKRTSPNAFPHKTSAILRKTPSLTVTRQW
jgi:hypothetical protein